VVDAPRAEARLGDHEALALPGDQVLRRNAHVDEVDFGVALLILVAEHGQTAQDADAGRVERHEDLTLLAVTRGIGSRPPGLAHHYQDPAMRVQRPRAPPLAPVQDVLVTVAGDPQGDVRRVGGGHVGLGHREARANLPVEQWA
jgi:hypothetical protein